jgi:hypothetical protein
MRNRTPVALRPKITFEEACRTYVYRYTMDYIPQWAHEAAPNGKFYAPQYRSDREWYESTEFPRDKRVHHCHSGQQTWPLGQWLNEPYKLT